MSERDHPDSLVLDMIADLHERIDRAVKELERVHNPARYPRIAGKIDGLLLVKDWLRSYE